METQELIITKTYNEVENQSWHTYSMSRYTKTLYKLRP